MAGQKKKTEKPPGRSTGSKNKKVIGSRVKDEIWAIIIIAIGTFLLIAVQTNAAGKFGEAIATLMLGTFGAVAQYVLPYYLILYGILLFAKRAAHIGGRSVVFLILIFLMIAIVNSIRFIDPEAISFNVVDIFDAAVRKENGGVFGMLTCGLLVKAIGKPGSYIFSFVIIIVSLMLVINTPISQFFDKMKLMRAQKREERELYTAAEEGAMEQASTRRSATVEPVKTRAAGEEPLLSGKVTVARMKILDYMKDNSLFKKEEAPELEKPAEPIEIEEEPQIQIKPLVHKAEPEIEQLVPKAEPEIEPSVSEEIHLGSTVVSKGKYQLPSLDFLNKGSRSDQSAIDINLKAKAQKLEETLSSFRVDAKVIQVTQGPAVTRYEIQPNVGVKVSSIVNLANDIALNLEAKSIRIEAPIPGKAAVGIEVENEKINMVTLRDILSSKEFKDSKSKITFAVGKDISGNAITANLKEMPHMLIAGSTGSGKSVCINSIIISILYKANPDEVKLVLIDPKVVELRNYNGIPHLLIPVVTEPSKAAAALNWAVTEMTDRYKKFADEGVRDLESFNDSVRKKNEEDRVISQIVIIIDELADLMMAAPSQVEESICRLAQMARAAGMHLIVATQRPSVDIITGVIKANIPSRIAFAVSSQFDSKTILDMGGAEKLVGKGDMLFNPIGSAKPIRVQGTFISDSEVHKVIEFVKSQTEEIEYASDVLHTIEKGNCQNDDDDGDELLADAIETVVKSGQASTSMLQRRFRIGYNRAARIVDMMEARGIIGPADGSRPRQVLMTEDEFYEAQEETKDLT